MFDKYQQAMASSADLIADTAIELWARRTTELLGAVLPILAVPDGTLWMARYSSRGSIERDPEQVGEVAFYLGRRYPVPLDPNRFITISHLHIMTKTAVTDLLQQIGEPTPNGIWQLLFEHSARA